MKKILVSAVLLLAAVFSGCDSEDPTGVVAYTVQFDRAGDVDEIRISLTGTNVEVTAAVSDTTSISGMLEAVPVGTHDVVAGAYAAGASQASVSVSASITVVEDDTAILALIIGDSVVESISVSNNTPKTGETVTLTANMADGSSPAVQWADNCAGSFDANGTTTVTWSNQEAESCTISVKVAASETSATTTELEVGLAKGTRVLLAGTGDCIGHAYDNYDYDDGATRVVDEVWSANGFYIDETGMGAKSIGFDRLTGLDLDGEGRVVFADRNGGHILRIEKDATLTRLAGTARPQDNRAVASGQATMSTSVYWPYGVAVSKDTGDIYFVEAWGYRVKLVRASDGTIQDLAGTTSSSSPCIANGAAGTSCRLGRYPTAIALDTNGDFYSGAQYRYDHLYRFYSAGTTAMTLRTDLEPWDIEISGDDLIITERHKHRIVRISKNGGEYEVLIGEEWLPGFDGDGHDSRSGLVNNPRGLFVDGDGLILFADTGNNRIRQIDTNGVITTVLEDAGVVSDLVLDANRNIIQTRHDTCSVEKVIGPF